MTRIPCTVLLAALLSGPVAPLARADDRAVETTFHLLVGFPDGSSTGVSLIPGTVIPGDSAVAVDRELARTEALAALTRQLRETLRLGRVEVRYEQKRTLALGDAPESLPTPSTRSTFTPSVQLVGMKGPWASYEVHFRDGDKTLRTVPVTVERGLRSVVGMLDGPEAPYLFLVVAPAKGDQPAPPGGAGPTPPRLTSRVAPAYPEAMQGVQGVVVLEVTIGTDGRVRHPKVLKQLHPTLDQNAVDAALQWVFEPATLDGEPVEVRYTLTFQFKKE